MPINSLIVQSGMNNRGISEAIRSNRQNNLQREEAAQNALLTQAKLAEYERQVAESERQQGLRRQLGGALQTPQGIARPDMRNHLAGILGEMGETKSAVGLAYPEMDMSADMQSFGALTKGMKPEDVERARRVKLGLDPRAGGGGMKFGTFTGADGIERPTRMNPATGNWDTFDGRQWVGLGADQQGQVMESNGAMPQQTLGTSRTPEDQAARTTVATETAKNRVGKEAGRTQANAATQARMAQAKMINELIDKAKSNANSFTTGFVGSVSGNVPGTPAHDMQNTLTTIQSNLGFDKLQQMRDESPTGGALGQVTEREHALLQAVWGSLQQSQSKEQFAENLERVRKAVHGAWKRVAEAYEKDYGVPMPADVFGGGQDPAQGAPEDDIDALLQQYGGP